MSFANLAMLWLLLVIPPALVAFFWWSARVRQRLLTQFIQARLLPSLTIGISPTRQKIRLGCLVMAVICLILALARPQWGFDWEEVRQRGLDIVVAIDTSKSMLAQDIAPNRLARAKLAALDLMQRARADRLGLVAFAGEAFLECPLTIDDSAFRQSVEALDVNTIPQGGTAIAEAIQTALGAYKEGDNYKVLVLLTDGEDHDSGAVEAAEKAAKEGLRIFTIGIGTAEGELLRYTDPQGKTDYVRDEQGNVVKSHLNERMLQQIASATEGGFYLPLRGAKAIDTLYDEGLAKLPKSQHQEKLVRRYHERYQWPLAAAIVLLLIEMLYPERKRERPQPAPAGKRGPVAAFAPPQNLPPVPEPAARSSMLQPQSSLLVLAGFMCLLLCPGDASASPSSALREYKSGNYEQALKEYERLLKKDKDDPRLHFNAGAAAYRNHQYDEAAKQFNATLAAPDLKLQGLGYYNEGNSLFHLGEANPDPKQRKDAWEKALQDFQSSLKLNPQDGDSKHNYEYVKRMLEELKQQQQQSKQDKQDQQQNQDQQKQQNQQQKDQQQKDQQKQRDQQQQQAQQNQKQESQQQQQADEQKQQQQQAEQQKQEQAKQQQAEQKQQEQQKQEQQQASAENEKSDDKDQQAAQAQAMAQMTPEQAKQLLDSQKANEQMLPPENLGKPVDRSRPFKDW
ncbi:MAG TPA: VWA domain-containing protein [Candidatus Acidoferrum sp.]|nr:VWA domain-containing protein [Candidatus Acidoferrum sp.]